MIKETETQLLTLTLDLALSLQVAEKTNTSLKGCWANALTALRKRKELQGGLYVEGWALLDAPIPIEHGWVQLPTGIVDPTYAMLMKRGMAESTNPLYFAGVTYTLSDLKGIPVAKLPHVWTFGGWGGFEHAPYKEAYEKAFLQATGVPIGALREKN